MIAVEAPSSPKEKTAAIAAAIKDLEKEFGKGTLMNLNERAHEDMPHIPTGILPLDNDVLGIGGFPKGRIIEVFGAESSGKTSLALTLVAAAQREGGTCAFVDAEHSLDPQWAQLLGVDLDKMLVSQPETGEEALQIVVRLVESKAFSVIIIDSVAALTPRAELEGEIGDATIGLQARMMSQALRILRGKVNAAGCVVVFINQLRALIGNSYGSNETTTGGRALKFYASVRLDVRRTGSIKQGEIAIGNTVKIKATKNKVAPPFRQCEVPLMFDRGFDTVGMLLDAAVEKGIAEKSGVWYSLDKERLGQGKQNAIDALRGNPQLLEDLRVRVDGASKD